MKNALSLTANGLTAALGKFLEPQLETLAGKIETAGELRGVPITATPFGDEGLVIQSDDDDAHDIVTSILDAEGHS